jgi:1-acyl-sn-glycerol-3-phosphate acyltransferase
MREQLLSAILECLPDDDLLARSDIRTALEGEIESAGPNALIALKERLASDGGWTYYPPDPLARRIHHLLAERFLDERSQLLGAQNLAALPSAPVVLVANHLSYADANVLEILLHRAGLIGVAGRLTAVAGPKVFTDRQRRFSSLCFGTIKVPQSADVASGEALASVREVAAGARQAIRTALARLEQRDVLLLFAEGTRSRDASMQQMLAGAARYLEAPATIVLPVGIFGSETLFPIGVTSVRRGRVDAAIGAPLPAERLLEAVGRDRRTFMDAIGVAIAQLVPASYRGAYLELSRFSEAAGALASAWQRV